MHQKHKSRRRGATHKTITVCDEQGYLPPIVINELWPKKGSDQGENSSAFAAIANQLGLIKGKKSIESSMESRSCPLNGTMKFEEISNIVGNDSVVTFLLLRELFLKVKIVKKTCCLDKKLAASASTMSLSKVGEDNTDGQTDDSPDYWCFVSEGLTRYGQSEVLLVLDKHKEDSCIPRDVFKIYLTLHELALRRQLLDNLGNLLFQDGLFGHRDTAGLVFVRPLAEHCTKNLILPQDDKNFLVALILQRWEVPWSKVFPMRLLFRLGHNFDSYPYPIVSFRSREPVFYEIGHTIISILGDFRNFRYSIAHVEGLKVMISKKTRTVKVRLVQSCYQQFNKVLDSTNNEHVLAWSSGPIREADGHLVTVQNDDGQYETVEFYKKTSPQNVAFEDLDVEPVIGASFIIFSGALKAHQVGQNAKISIVEDGLLIQIQSSTMASLRESIHYMRKFTVDSGENCQDALVHVDLEWQSDEIQ